MGVLPNFDYSDYFLHFHSNLSINLNLFDAVGLPGFVAFSVNLFNFQSKNQLNIQEFQYYS